jgi:N-methylhydantoinase A
MLLGVDVGGTFTDAALLADDGQLFTAKAPSTPGEQQLGVMAAVEAVLARAGAAPADVARFAHGMTVATNALLEGRAARTALVATEGLTDLVELGRQARPSLYRLCEAPPAPLAPPQLRFAAPERMTPEGQLRALDAAGTAAVVEAVAGADPQAVAVVLLHSYAHPQHERRLGEALAARLPDVHLSLSHELVGTFREYERAATTEVDAALSPLLATYLRGLSERCERQGLPSVQVMQSSGGLTDATMAARHAAVTVLSGPAGGVGGALLLSAAAGERDVLCFDMGGTSCDVCLIESDTVAETAQRQVADRPLALPALDIHTVGAGGGSIAWRDQGGALRVGPRSAGAVPGPASYGRGGKEPTVTDANLVLGRLPAEGTLAGGVALQPKAAFDAVAALAGQLGLSPLACAEGIVKVAETEMLRALRVMTVQRGIDPRRFALMPFGGAGPLHAASMAQELGIGKVLCPRASGVLSALGLAAAAPRRDAAATPMLRGETFTAERLRAELDRLAERARSELAGPCERLRARFEMRYEGQSHELSLERDLTADPASLQEGFAALHEERYGYRDERSAVELVNVRVSAFGPSPGVTLTAARQAEPERGELDVVFAGEPIRAQLWRGEPAPGTAIAGPSVWALPESTLLVPPGWHGAADEHGTIVLERR